MKSNDKSFVSATAGLFAAAAAIVLVACITSSCEKSAPDIYRGYFSFKTGGYVNITGKVYDIRRDTVSIDTTIRQYHIADTTLYDTTYVYHTVNDTIAERDTAFSRNLLAESGQMHVLCDNGDNVKVTMNITGGNPVVFDATASKTSLSLKPVRRQVYIFPDDEADGQSISFLFDVCGVGQRFENMILFDLEYSGRYNYDGVEGDITSSNVKCIATENE